jgi:hypothetical protein
MDADDGIHDLLRNLVLRHFKSEYRLVTGGLFPFHPAHLPVAIFAKLNS